MVTQELAFQVKAITLRVAGWTFLIFFCLSSFACAESTSASHSGGDHIIGFALASSVLSGNRTMEQGYYHDGRFIRTGSINAPNHDLFDSPLSAGFIYGIHPNGQRLLLTAELALAVVESRRALIMSPYAGPELSRPNNSDFLFAGSLQVEALRLLSNYHDSPVLPEAGVFANFGAGNLERISRQSIAFSAGPVVAVDLRFSRDMESLSFTALHVSLAYSQSFTAGWPSRLELSSGLRYSWR